MIKKFNHIAVAVSDIEKSIETYSRLFDTEPLDVLTVEEQGVRVAIFNIDGVMYELIKPLDLDNPIARFIDSRGNALHHVAFSVDSINEAIGHFNERGFKTIGSEPRTGAEGKPIIFMHPKTTDGILIELIEDKQKELL
ncbi:MAG: methylmalonyl-CoA epimerase [bacterium]